MSQGTHESPAQGDAQTGSGSRGYANYVLVVLVIVYVFNFIDRQILSILAEDIKGDLGLTDAQLGFLYGTAFAVFYAIFGIPLSRLADIWVRKSLISVGLLFWSLMTALSGVARSFVPLATFRIGVGVGESSASPAAFSMLGDYFPPRLRATAVAIYSSGVYIGSGIGLFIGGLVVDGWNEHYADGGAPFGLVGWQAAFFVVGIPGLLMALWVWTLKEPVRGQSEGIVEKAAHPTPFREFFREMSSVLPPLTLLSLWQHSGARAVVNNLLIAAGCAGGAWGMILFAPTTKLQWIALAVGLYAFFSWLQSVARRDPAAFGMIYRSKAIVFGMVGFAWMAFVGYGMGYFLPSFFQRVHGASAAQAGTLLGVGAALGGWFGVTSGGIISDWARRWSPRARPYVGIAFCVLAGPVGLVLLTTTNTNFAYVLNFFFQALSSAWIGSAVALANELVVPRMRATASAYYILAVTFIGLALGPFTMGYISTQLAAGGTDGGQSLKTGMMVGLSAYVLAVVFLWIASRFVEREEISRLDRARALGEAV